MYSSVVIDAVSSRFGVAPDIANRDVLTKNLTFFYQVITASERLLEQAAVQASGELAQYFRSHLEEERDHATWLAQDLTHFDVDVATAPIMRSAIQMVGTQYYLINHVDPCCLLGYMAVLEGFSASIEAIEALERMHGKEGLRTLRYHVEHDPDHRVELFSMIDKIARPEILWSAIETVTYLNDWDK